MVGNSARLGASQRSHHATLRVAPHRYATREPLGTPGGSRAFSADGHPQSPGVLRRSCAARTFFVAQSWAECITNMPRFNLRQAQAVGSGTRKMFMPKQKLHTHEEVFADHVSGRYDETIFRFRVPGGWIYTHTIIRFGSVDKSYI
jgi:hypothetical protein